MRTLILMGILSTTTALAAPQLHPKNGESVRVVLGEKRERGVGLRPANGEWRLELGRVDADCAELYDVTAGASGARWLVRVSDGALRFEADRFVPDHAYRVELRHGLRTVAATLVYLFPPPATARQTLQFDQDRDGPDGEMATLPKPTL